MKFSITLEYSEKEYLAATKNSGSMLPQFLSLLAALRTAKGGGAQEVAELLTPAALDGATVLPFPVAVPPTANPPDEPETLPNEAVKQQKLLRKGEKAFRDFIHEWLKGIDIDTLLPREGVEQPDRDMLLRTVASSSSSWALLQYVQSCGGLQQAIAKVTNSERLGVELARFIVPPASIAFYDLSDLYEYTNPFKKEDEE